MSIPVRRATAQDAPLLAQMLEDLGLFSQVSGETSQSIQARVVRDLQFHDSDDCHSVYVAVGATGEIVGHGVVH